MNERRTRLGLEAFCMEHRVRRFLCAGAPSSTQEGRELRKVRADKLMEHYARLIDEQRLQNNI